MNYDILVFDFKESLIFLLSDYFNEENSTQQQTKKNCIIRAIFLKKQFYFIWVIFFRVCVCVCDWVCYLKMYAIRRYVNFKQLSKFEHCGRLANIGQSSLVSDSKRTFYTYSPEPSQPINRDPTFCSIEDAVKCVKSGKLFMKKIRIFL